MCYVLALFYEEVKTNHGQTAYAMLSINQSQSFSLQGTERITNRGSPSPLKTPKQKQTIFVLTANLDLNANNLIKGNLQQKLFNNIQTKLFANISCGFDRNSG